MSCDWSATVSRKSPDKARGAHTPRRPPDSSTCNATATQLNTACYTFSEHKYTSSYSIDRIVKSSPVKSLDTDVTNADTLSPHTTTFVHKTQNRRPLGLGRIDKGYSSVWTNDKRDTSKYTAPLATGKLDTAKPNPLGDPTWSSRTPDSRNKPTSTYNCKHSSRRRNRRS